jgi:mannose-6-phosphate isomerase-like protein (cupin superfamily)
MSAINVADKFSQFDEHWSPRVIAELNGQAVKLAKVAGTFVWHDHAEEDELFLVFRGTLHIDFHDRETVTLREGELFVVPRGTVHRPRTPEGQETWIMLLEPIQTKHTGDVQHPLTVTEYKRL